MANPISQLYIRIKAEITDAVTKLGIVKGSVDKIGDSTEKASAAVERSNKRSILSFQSLGSAAKAAVGVIAGIVGVFGGIAASVFNANKEFQALKASLETVTGSAESADAAFSVIEEFAKTTPFQLNEVVDAFIKLKALGLDPSIEALTSYGNTASAMGKSLNQVIEAVADASVGEFERLKEFGIKASKEGEQITFTFQGVKTSVQNNAEAIQGYLLGLGNVQFAGGMERQMNTLGGQASNLSDAFSGLARDIGNAGINDAIRSLFDDAIGAVGAARSAITENLDTIAASVRGVLTALNFFANLTLAVFNGITLAARGLVRAFFGYAADINGALATITFGDTSRDFQVTADNLRATADELGNDISQDAEDIKNALSRAFTAPDFQSGQSIPVTVTANAEQDAAKIVNDVSAAASAKASDPANQLTLQAGVDPAQAVAQAQAARDAAQASVKPIVIPIIYQNAAGTSFSDRPSEFNNIARDALTGGSR